MAGVISTSCGSAGLSMTAYQKLRLFRIPIPQESTQSNKVLSRSVITTDIFRFATFLSLFQSPVYSIECNFLSESWRNRARIPWRHPLVASIAAHFRRDLQTNASRRR